MSFQLIDHFGRVYQISRDVTTIGPRNGNDIVIPEMSGAGTVLMLERNGNYWQLETADPSVALSINGTSARGVQYLRHLDVLQANGIALRFVDTNLIGARPAASTAGPAAATNASGTSHSAGRTRPTANSGSLSSPAPPQQAYPPQSAATQRPQPTSSRQPTSALSPGRPTTKVLAIASGVLVMLAIFALLFALIRGRFSDGPARAAKEWVTAVATSDGATALSLTCDSYQDQVQMSGFLTAGLGMLFGVDTQSTEADLSSLEFNTINQAGDTATVQVQGELVLSLLGAAMPQQLDTNMTMVREDGEWKYCGDDMAADLLSQSPANVPSNPPDLQATIAFSVEATQSALEQNPAVPEATATVEVAETQLQLPDVAPAPLPSADILWADDFEDGISDSWNIVFGDWRTSNGYLVPTDERTNSLIVGGDTEWTDYTVSVDIDQFSYLYYAGGVLVRMQDSQNFMRATAHDSVLSHGTDWEIVVDGEARIVPGTDVSRSMGRPPYNLTIRVNGPKYELYVDGELQSSFTDTTFTRGYIGLQSYGYQGLPSNPHLAGFDNLVVTRD